MRLRPAWGTTVYVNEAFAFHPRDFGQCRAEQGLVVCGVKTGEVIALTADAGRVLWRFPARGAVRARPAIEQRQVYVGSADGCLYRLAVEDGRPTWEKPFCTDAAIEGDPVVVGAGDAEATQGSDAARAGAGPLVLFATMINKVYAVRAADGAFVWEYHRDRPQFLSSEGVASPVVAGDRVYAGFSDGNVAALSWRTGEPAWVTNLASDPRKATDVDVSPLVDGDTVYAASFARGPVAIQASDGRPIWQGTWFGVTRPILRGDLLVFGTADGEVIAARKADARVVYRTHFGARGAAYPPVLVRGVIVAGHDRGLYVLDGTDLAPLEVLSIPMGVFTAPEVQRSRLFFVGAGGSILAVDVLPR